MRIKRESSQLLIIDMQKKLLDLMEDGDRIIDRTARVMKAAQRFEIPMVLSEQNPEKLGATISEIEMEAGPEARMIPKMEFSCLLNDILSEQLHFYRKKGLSQVIICGVEAHICIVQTVMDLEDQGFEAFVVADAISSREPESWDLSLDRMARCGAEIVDSEMVLFEWMEKAGTPEFKELLPLVK